MDYFKELSNLKPRKQSISSEESTSSTNSLLNSLKNFEDEEFQPPKLRSQRKISIEEKIPDKYKEIFPINLNKLISKRKDSEQEKSITQKIKEFLGPKPKETEEDKLLVLDEKREIEEIITSKGFKYETHFITT